MTIEDRIYAKLGGSLFGLLEKPGRTDEKNSGWVVIVPDVEVQRSVMSLINTPLAGEQSARRIAPSVRSYGDMARLAELGEPLTLEQLLKWNVVYGADSKPLKELQRIAKGSQNFSKDDLYYYLETSKEYFRSRFEQAISEIARNFYGLVMADLQLRYIKSTEELNKKNLPDLATPERMQKKSFFTKTDEKEECELAKLCFDAIDGGDSSKVVLEISEIMDRAMRIVDKQEAVRG